MLHFLQCKRNGSYRRQLQKATLPKALVYGAGSAGLQLMSAMDNNHEISVVGFLDDDHRLHGHLLNCQPIFSLNDLPSLIQSKGVTHVLLAIPSASRRWRNEILESMGKASHRCLHLVQLDRSGGGSRDHFRSMRAGH